MSSYRELIETTLKTQISTIGKPVALRQVKKIEEVVVDDEGNILNLKGDGKEVLGKLVSNFESITGPVAIATTVRAIKKDFGEKIDLELPEILRDEF